MTHSSLQKGATFVLKTFELITEFPMPIGRLLMLCNKVHVTNTHIESEEPVESW